MVGVLECASGERFEGEWKNSLMNGKGTYIGPNEEKYEGDWVDGKIEGEGSFYTQY
jgi:hypothetical protein